MLVECGSFRVCCEMDVANQIFRPSCVQTFEFFSGYNDTFHFSLFFYFAIVKSYTTPKLFRMT